MNDHAPSSHKHRCGTPPHPSLSSSPTRARARSPPAGEWQGLPSSPLCFPAHRTTLAIPRDRRGWQRAALHTASTLLGPTIRYRTRNRVRGSGIDGADDGAGVAPILTYDAMYHNPRHREGDTTGRHNRSDTAVGRTATVQLRLTNTGLVDTQLSSLQISGRDSHFPTRCCFLSVCCLICSDSTSPSPPHNLDPFWGVCASGMRPSNCEPTGSARPCDTPSRTRQGRRTCPKRPPPRLFSPRLPSEIEHGWSSPWRMWNGCMITTTDLEQRRRVIFGW